MAVLETKHTRSRLNVIKRDLSTSVAIFSYVSMLAFLVYYVYLIIQNTHRPLYLVIYSVMIVTIIALFLIETLIHENKKLLRHEKRRSTEKKRKLKFVTKIFKFTAKFTLIGIAVLEAFTSREISVSNIINVCSLVFLVLQIIFEFIISRIIKQIDYLRLSVELDIEESGIFKSVLSFVFKEKKLEEKAILAQGGSLHTPQEEKMIAEIKTEAENFEAKDRQRREEIRNLFHLSKSTKKKDKKVVE